MEPFRLFVFSKMLTNFVGGDAPEGAALMMKNQNFLNKLS